jgi:hypothetical protein
MVRFQGILARKRLTTRGLQGPLAPGWIEVGAAIGRWLSTESRHRFPDPARDHRGPGGRHQRDAARIDGIRDYRPWATVGEHDHGYATEHRFCQRNAAFLSKARENSGCRFLE